MKLLLYLLLLSIVFTGCKKDNNPVEPDNGDKNPPSIIIQTPTTEEGYVTLNGNLTIAGVASDDQGIKEIKWYLNSVEKGAITVTENWSIPDIQLQQGDNVFSIVCTDNGGNSAADTIIVTKNQSIEFLSIPKLNPGGVAKNEYTSVIVTIPIKVTNDLISSEVKLMKYLGPNSYSELGNLVDNGSLSDGDEIANDGVFSAKISFYESTIGNLKLRVSAKSNSTGGQSENYSAFANILVYEPVLASEYIAISEVQKNAVSKLNEFSSDKNLDGIISKTAAWIQTQSNVSSVKTGAGSIIIHYKNGITGGMIISQLDNNGNVVTKGGVSSDTSRYQVKQIPVNHQTRGTNSKLLYKRNNNLEIDPNIIRDKDVLIYAPFEDAFAIDMRPTLEAIISSSDLKFNVDVLVNTGADITALNNLAEYGLIIFDTHGAQGEYLLTGERVTTENKKTYESLLKQNKLAIFNDVVVDKIWFFSIKDSVYGVTSSFISSINGTMPKSVIFNGSCESTMGVNLENAFMGKGAKTYYGFTKVVNTAFCKTVADSTVKRLVKDLKTTGESFLAGTDSESPNAVSEIKGNHNMYFFTGLINGDFEFGNLDGWKKEGDGRVITRLGSINPFGSYEGIISTGLGYTTATGQISQSFKVGNTQSTLKIKWNFLSEEFLEYINSQYQDYFVISIKTNDGTEVVLLSKTIDNIAADFGATKESAGSLIPVSPEIVFDRGGVFKTDWITSTFDISAYRGKSITLILKAGDVGDSIYDSAILLDEITVE